MASHTGENSFSRLAARLHGCWRRAQQAGMPLFSVSVVSGETHVQTDYPTAPVRIISDSSPGSTVDVAPTLTTHELFKFVFPGCQDRTGSRLFAVRRAAERFAVRVSPRSRPLRWRLRDDVKL